MLKVQGVAEDLGGELGSQRDFGSRHAATAVAGRSRAKAAGAFILFGRSYCNAGRGVENSHFFST